MRPFGPVVSAALFATVAGCAKPARTVSSEPPGAVAVVATPELTAEDIVRLESVSDLALSPDGKTIAFVRRTPRGPMDAPGAARNSIWMVSAEGGTPRRYTAADSTSYEPHWSPDGRWLGFLSARPGEVGAQLYRISPRGGEAERLTDVSGGVRHFAWSPAGKQVAFLAAVPKTQAETTAAAQGRDWQTSDVHGTSRRVFVFAPGTDAQPRMLGGADHHIEQFSWSPDGRRLAVQASRRADVDGVMMYSGLFVADLEGGWRSLTQTAGKLGALSWSPDGQRIAFLGASDLHDPTAGVVHVVAASGGVAKPLTAAFEGTGSALRWVDAQRVLLLVNEDTTTSLKALHPDTGAMEEVRVGPQVCRRFDVDADAKTLGCIASSPRHPNELFVGPLGEPLTRTTHLNTWLSHKALGRQEVVRWVAADGTALAGVFIHPAGPSSGSAAPLVVLPHGGPEGISLNGWTTWATYPAQLFAARGFAVLMPNYRGSQGRGVAFGKADQRDLGGKEFEDVLAGIDHLAAKGLIDPDRVGMGGWSYGGYFSGLAATLHSSRFRAAMVGAAITNWVSFTGTTEIEHENSLVHWDLWPYEQPALAWERSPMAHLRSAKTATLVVHGQNDTRVPPQQALELYRGLRHFGTHAEIVLYPREGHGLAERAHQLDFAERFVGFFEIHVLAPKAQP